MWVTKSKRIYVIGEWYSRACTREILRGWRIGSRPVEDEVKSEGGVIIGIGILTQGKGNYT